ncbi:MAG: FtsX-like permease family protein, partial [Bacteroidetes bacterium]|nr:FtsX-like permease family protein [Bacteroidota bacterium]
MEAGGNLIDLKVSGVMKAMPTTSHFHFDFIASMSTFIGFVGKDAPFLRNKVATAFYTYIRATDPEAVQLQLNTLYEKNTSEGEQQFLKGFFLQPLTDIHLYSNLIAEIEANSNILYIYVFIFVAILTLIIACINFMNLSTARSANRSKEVGLRKVVGALRGDLIQQFIGESLLVAVLAIILAVVIAELLISPLNNAAGIDLKIDYLGDPAIILGLIGIAVFVGLIAGAYPAFFLSRFRPIQVLRGNLRSGAKSGTFRKVLVVFQFAISTAMIIGSGIL